MFMDAPAGRSLEELKTLAFKDDKKEWKRLVKELV